MYAVMQWRIHSWSQGGVSITRKFKWLVKVGASIYQTPDLKKVLAGGVSGQPKILPGYATGHEVSLGKSRPIRSYQMASVAI